MASIENVVASSGHIHTATSDELAHAFNGPKFEGTRVDDFDYKVTLPNSEGPLDLLLHLIRREQINIYDIPITKICENYLRYLELLKTFDPGLAGEFMVMATTLIYIKSLVLLPVEGEDEEADPRRPLVAQLLEYERFKLAAQKIDAMPWLGRELYGRPEGALKDVVPVESLLQVPIEGVDPYQLLLALKVSVDRTTKKPITITTDPVSIKDKVSVVAQRFGQAEVVEFSQLMVSTDRLQEIITSFLAVLELAKLRFIEIIQTEPFGVIQIKLKRPLNDLNLGMLDQY